MISRLFSIVNSQSSCCHKWITDKDSGAFYGSSFVEMESCFKAAEAVAKSGSQLMGRPIKINFAPARSGDVWPPTTTTKSLSGSGNSGQAGGKGVKAMSAKPPDCKKLFIGNLSYDIDDEGIGKFFASVNAEVKAVRWLHHRDSGDFKGWYDFCKVRCCSSWLFLISFPFLSSGFVEFWSTEVRGFCHFTH